MESAFKWKRNKSQYLPWRWCKG